jgi:hypothetical protein
VYIIYIFRFLGNNFSNIIKSVKFICKDERGEQGKIVAKSLEMLAEESNFALVVGIGGGGDVIGAIPTARYLRWLGLKTLLGGTTWERYVIDPEPGPRKMDEIINIKRLSKTVGLANAQTRTTRGVRFTEAIVAEILGEEVVLVDLNQGVRGVTLGLREAMEELGADLFVGIDVGGDVLAEGTEQGLYSMLADNMMLAAMVNLKVPAVLGVLGYGSDGELGFKRLNENIARIASYGGFLGARGLTPEDVKVLEGVIKNTKTEATALAVEAAKGRVGEIEIRGGQRKVFLTPASSITFYFDPLIVFERMSRVARKLIQTESLDEANVILERMGVGSELNFERNYIWKKYTSSDKLYGGGR